MKLAVKSRPVLFFLVTVAVIVAAVSSADWSAEDKKKPAVAAVDNPSVKAGKRDATGPDELDWARLQRATPVGEVTSAFESTSWYVPPPPPPPPPPAKPVPPPPPAAPPLPFTYLGQYQDAAKPIFFLVRGDSVLSVSEGDVIDGAYRVDGVVGTALSLTYLPLNSKQTLSTGDAG